MGIIDIRTRSAQLGNIGAVQRVDTRNGAAEVYGAQERLGQTVANLGQGLMSFAVDIDRRMERNALDAYCVELQQKMTDWNEGGVRPDGTRTGAMHVPMGEEPDAAARWMEKNTKMLEDTETKLLEKHGIKGRWKGELDSRLAGFRTSLAARWVHRATTEAKRREVSGAQASFETAQNNMHSPGANADTAKEWRDSANRYLDAMEVFDSEARKGFLRKSAMGILQKAMENDINALTANTGPDGGGEFDRRIAEFSDKKKDAKSQLLPPWSVVKDENGKSANLLGEALEGSDLEGMRAAYVKDLKLAKSRWKAERDHEEAEARRAVVKDFTQRELSLRDVPQELWANKYDEMGKDEELKKAAPDQAMSYRDTAAKMREAEKRAKEMASVDAIKSNENRIYGRLINFIYDKKFGILSGQAAADEQAAVWRDFRVAVSGRAVGEDFPDRFTARLDKELNDQQAEAMRYTMQLFGYNADTDSRGRVGAAERKKAIDKGHTFNMPFKEEGWIWDSQPTISASQLFDYLDRLWRLLDRDDKGGNRLEMAKKMADGMKEEWVRGGNDGMIEGLADNFMKERIGRRAEEEYREAK